MREKIYVRLKYERGGIDDESYDFKDLASGKPQLYRVCPPPPRAQWTYDADRDRGRRHERDDRDSYDRRGDHDRYWHPQWPQPPIDPPRVRSLTQEQTIRDEHKSATRRGTQQ